MLYALLSVQVKCLRMNKSLNSPYVCFTLGHQKYYTRPEPSDSSSSSRSAAENGETSEWHRVFEFPVSLHAHLFWSLLVDVFDRRTILTDRHVGRAEIRLCRLEKSFPSSFFSWFEIWRKDLADSNVSILRTRRTLSSNMGAIQLSVSYNQKIELLKNIKIQKKITRSSSQTNLTEIREPHENDIIQLPFESAHDEVKMGSFIFTLTGWLLPKSALPSLQLIYKLLMGFKQGTLITSSQAIAGISILYKYYNTVNPHRSQNIITDKTLITELKYFFQYSMASYGWWGLNYAGKGNGLIRDSFRSHSDRKSVLEHLKMDEKDLLLLDFTAESVFKPCHFIALDRKKKAIVLCIRGTMSLVDAVTDLVCEYEEWNGGYVHAGIKKAADWFFLNLIPKVLEFRKEYPDCQNIIVVGHSLGAAVASLLTMIIKNHHNSFYSELPIHAYCFGPPGVTSAATASASVPYITTLINGNDITPQLAYGAMMDFKEMIIAALEGYQPGLWTDLDLSKPKFAKLHARLTECHEYIQSHINDNPKLFLPGRIIHVYQSSIPSNRKFTLAEESNPEFFASVQPRRSMLAQHLPAKYDQALDRALSCLEQEEEFSKKVQMLSATTVNHPSDNDSSSHVNQIEKDDDLSQGNGEHELVANFDMLMLKRDPIAEIKKQSPSME